MRDADSPQKRELDRKLQENTDEKQKLLNTPSGELNPLVTHAVMLDLAKKKDAILEEVLMTASTPGEAAKAAHARKVTKDEIAREEQAVYNAAKHL